MLEKNSFRFSSFLYIAHFLKSPKKSEKKLAPIYKKCVLPFSCSGRDKNANKIEISYSPRYEKMVILCFFPSLRDALESRKLGTFISADRFEGRRLGTGILGHAVTEAGHAVTCRAQSVALATRVGSGIPRPESFLQGGSHLGLAANHHENKHTLHRVQQIRYPPEDVERWQQPGDYVEDPGHAHHHH